VLGAECGGARHSNSRVWIRAAAGRQTDKARKEEEKTKKKNERIKKGKRKTQKNKKLIDGPICQCLIPKFKSSKQTKNRNGLVLHNQTLIGFSVLFLGPEKLFYQTLIHSNIRNQRK
jgi:hypothetical protein